MNCMLMLVLSENDCLLKTILRKYDYFLLRHTVESKNIQRLLKFYSFAKALKIDTNSLKFA